MLSVYERIARRLWRVRALVWAAAALALVAFFAIVLFSPGGGDDAWMAACVAVFLWALSLGCLVHAFVTPAPVVAPGDRFATRVGKRLARAGRGLLAVTMTVLLVVAVFVTWKAVGIALRAGE